MKENGVRTGVIMVVIFAAGILLGYYFGSTNTSIVNTGTKSVGSQVANEQINSTNEDSVADTVPEEGIKVDSAALSDGQKKVLQTLGVDTENITITPEMVACAEAKVGSARLAEIQGGDSPSIMEGASLVTCYK